MAKVFGPSRKKAQQCNLDLDVLAYIKFRTWKYRVKFSTEVNTHYAEMMANDKVYQEHKEAQSGATEPGK